MSILSIGKWNYKRNRLILDEELEKNMLAEEEDEFKQGFRMYLELTTNDNLFKDELVINSVVEMIDAYCDFMYVYTGTSLKSIGTPFVFDYSHKQSLLNSVLSEILITHGTTMYKQGTIPFIEQCYSFVIDANEAKTGSITMGKVTKGNDFKDPKILIRELLLKSGFLVNTDEALDRYKQEISEKIDPKKVVPINNLEGSKGSIA